MLVSNPTCEAQFPQPRRPFGLRSLSNGKKFSNCIAVTMVPRQTEPIVFRKAAPSRLHQPIPAPPSFHQAIGGRRHRFPGRSLIRPSNGRHPSFKEILFRISKRKTARANRDHVGEPTNLVLRFVRQDKGAFSGTHWQSTLCLFWMLRSSSTRFSSAFSVTCHPNTF